MIWNRHGINKNNPRGNLDRDKVPESSMHSDPQRYILSYPDTSF